MFFYCPPNLQRQLYRGIHMPRPQYFASQCGKNDPRCYVQWAVSPTKHKPFKLMGLCRNHVQCMRLWNGAAEFKTDGEEET